ncbi:hypothetical protein [Bacillus massiliigorillae]|uniref:hypothetical protein n=1 Tax=Bacillus massiliigorillae TaxID=1243664 RepID=UPI0003A23130|nr:hypothetical protein [Bacillus massiliigorillae]
MKWLLQLLILVAVVSVGYKYRYKLMNTFLGIGIIRKFIVAQSMKLPMGSAQFIQRLYQPF